MAKGYAGAGDGKNDPLKQGVRNVGPLPVGLYVIGLPVEGTKMGPLAIPLEPHHKNEMFGRSEFYIHGDNATHTASTGCIIMDRPTRQKIMDSDDDVLVVV
jgi:hypothetical protein